ncbi:ExbD/TolR family protein [Planctomycetota bacterium]
MRHRIKHHEIKADMTAMIDVVFLLLIFFMCAANFKTLDCKLQTHLPKLGSLPVPLDQPVFPRYVELKVKSYTSLDGQPVTERVAVFLGERELGVYLRPRFAANLAEKKARYSLRAEIYRDLTDLLLQGEQDRDPAQCQPVFIAPDARVPHADVVQALDAVKRAGICDLTFAAVPVPGN